jgi:Family of unknown function (DUF6129)
MINEQDLENIVAVLKKGELGDTITRGLKAKWPDIHFTYCLDDDISAAHPVREYETFNLYYVSGNGGCISFTSSAERATGLVIAEIEEKWEMA